MSTSEKFKKITSSAGKKIIGGVAKASRAAGKKIATGTAEAGRAVGNKIAISTSETGKNIARKTLDMVDVNDDGKFDLNDVIILGLKTPGCKIKRYEFLQKELEKSCMPDIVEKAVESNPLAAGITKTQLDEIAKSIILFESTCVTGASAALGAAGTFSIAASVPADIVQYHVYILRTIQKLIYLYGFPEILTEDEQEIKPEILNFYSICLGVMYNVAGANELFDIISKELMENKNLLGSDSIMSNPILNKILSSAGKNITKKIVSGVISNILPVVGGVINGGITYVNFKPCCNRLRKALKNLYEAEEILVESTENNKAIEPVSTVNDVSSYNIINEIKAYKKLLDENIITQEEFDLKKKQLLNL